MTTEYAELLDFAMSYRLEKLKQNQNTRIICFGEDFHPLIKPIIYKYANKGLISSRYIKLRGKVSSRSGGLNEDSLQNVLRFLPDQEASPESPSSQYYYCNKFKLNQPCLLPDGSMNICSFDYGFRNVYGDLFTNKLVIYIVHGSMRYLINTYQENCHHVQSVSIMFLWEKRLERFYIWIGSVS